MCGFVGFTGTLENRADIIKRMADRIIHRGPDMEGYHVGEDGITLGFRRLSTCETVTPSTRPLPRISVMVWDRYSGMS